MSRNAGESAVLAAAITKSASKQTYYTIHLLADRERRADACRAYAYFRWVDDLLDDPHTPPAERLAFLARQQDLLNACYRRATPGDLCAEEWMLVDLVGSDQEENSGLQVYLWKMMAVMAFDVRRCGRLVSAAELNQYTGWLAMAVSEALFYFIGHDDAAPRAGARYLAVNAAHVTHMLRDACEDAAAGYFNIPAEVVQAGGMAPQDIHSRAYRRWVLKRVRLARRCFQEGRAYLAQVPNLRCRLAGFAYIARFEWILAAIERDEYRLRQDYSQRKSLPAGLSMGASALAGMFASFSGGAREKAARRTPAGRSPRVESQ